ncbi:MAG: hypothetical protein R3C14_41760 [Caldilineaceae bacterium]
MRRFRTITPILLVLGLLFCQTPAVALAVAPATENPTTTPTDMAAYGIHCAAGRCTFQIKEAGVSIPQPVAAGATLLLTFLQDKIHLLPTGTGLQITDDVTIETPMGPLALFNTDLTLELGNGNQLERLQGTAEVPWPTLVGNDNSEGKHALAVANLGWEAGRNLTQLNLPLEAAQHYLFLRLGAGVQTDATGAIQRETLHAVATPVTRGQYLTLLFAPHALDFWVDGNLTIALLDELLTLNEFLTEQTGLPFELASEAINLHLSGRMGYDWSAAYLRLDGLYTLEKRFIRNWFQTDASPLLVTGSLQINHEGVLLSGLTRSSVLPDRLFDGALALEAFVPFSGDLGRTYVATTGQATAPLAAWQHASEQRFTLAPLRALMNEAVAVTAQQAARVQSLFMTVKDLTSNTVVYAARGYQASQTLASHGYEWTVETVIDSAHNVTAAGWAGLHSVQELASHSYAWTAAQLSRSATAVGATAAQGYYATLEAAGAGYSWTAEQASAGVAAFGTFAVAGYKTFSCKAADSLDQASAWLWPQNQPLEAAFLVEE